ncbi:MAG: FAD-dependent oxidoreductase [Bacteroidia bacterium]
MEKETHVHHSGEKITAGSHSSVWIDTVQPLAFRKLEENIETDVVIVGGGMAGISIAYNLVKSGKKVVIVEDGFVGSGETGRTTAHLVTALDDRYYELQKMFGDEKTKLVAESHKTAIDFIERATRREHIDCDFERVDGYLFLHPSDDVESLGKEFEAAENAGVEVEKLERVPGMEKYYGPCLRFANQAQFHPLKYIKALCEVIQNNGGVIYTNAHAQKIDHTGIVTDKGYKVTAKHIVVSTNTPVNNKVVMHLKQYAYRTYVIGAKIKKDSLPKSLWWDTGEFTVNENIPPYHYVRTQKLDSEHDLLIIGGEDHATGIAGTNKSEEESYSTLEKWAKEYFEIGDIIFKWSGQVMEPMDSLAYIGRNPFDKDNVYIVTGDSGNGMTHTTIAAMLITDLINGKENKFEKLYDPSRLKLIDAGKIFFKEFVGGFANYFKEKKQNTAQENDLNTIAKNEGKIIEVEGKKYGVFCDENNNYHVVSADCTHLKCTVSWNNDEKSWDCPCHGSRFTCEGKVVNGPANTDLPYHKEQKDIANGTVLLSNGVIKK